MADKIPEAPERKKIKVAPSKDSEEPEKQEKKKDPGKGRQEPKYEDNVISRDEFSDLEKKEGKQIKVKKEKKEESMSPGHTKASDVDLLLLKTEKIEGKIESITDSRKAIEERLSGLNQEIGELRSSIMEKDRAIREFQSGFTKIKDMAEGMEPAKITAQFAKKEEEIERIQAMMESQDLQIKESRKEIKANSKIIENIRDIENLVAVVRKLKEKVNKVEEDRKYTTRTAGKIETMFSDLSDKLGEFQGYKDKIGFNEETMHEIMKTVDSIEGSLQEVARKDDLKKSQESIDTRFERIRIEVDDKMFEVRKLLDDLLTGLRDAGLKGVLEKVGKVNLEKMFATKGDFEELNVRLEKLRTQSGEMVKEKQKELAMAVQEASPVQEGAPSQGQETYRQEAQHEEPPREVEKDGLPIAPGGQPEREEAPTPEEMDKGEEALLAIRDKIDSMISQAEESIKLGNMDIAKNMYREALNMYNQLNQAETYQEASQTYDRIRRLYARLRIYS